MKQNRPENRLLYFGKAQKKISNLARCKIRISARKKDFSECRKCGIKVAKQKWRRSNIFSKNYKIEFILKH